MIRVSAVYPNAAGSRFDADYYQHRHEPFAIELLGPLGLQGLRTTLGEAALDGGGPPYWAISELHFASRAIFDAAIAQCGEALFADIPNYTNVAPVLQISRPGSETNLEGA
jgi:uncharacterized protein (TIGR02118 family)